MPFAPLTFNCLSDCVVSLITSFGSFSCTGRTQSGRSFQNSRTYRRAFGRYIVCRRWLAAPVRNAARSSQSKQSSSVRRTHACCCPPNSHIELLSLGRPMMSRSDMLLTRAGSHDSDFMAYGMANSQDPSSCRKAWRKRHSRNGAPDSANARQSLDMWGEISSVKAQSPRQSECCADLGRKSSDGEPAISPKQNYRGPFRQDASALGAGNKLRVVSDPLNASAP